LGFPGERAKFGNQAVPLAGGCLIGMWTKKAWLAFQKFADSLHSHSETEAVTTSAHRISCRSIVTSLGLLGGAKAFAIKRLLGLEVMEKYTRFVELIEHY
jgi:hypothetical protein